MFWMHFRLENWIFIPRNSTHNSQSASWIKYKAFSYFVSIRNWKMCVTVDQKWQHHYLVLQLFENQEKTQCISRLETIPDSAIWIWDLNRSFDFVYFSGGFQKEHFLKSKFFYLMKTSKPLLKPNKKINQMEYFVVHVKSNFQW